jgi:hypothetical protein
MEVGLEFLDMELDGQNNLYLVLGMDIKNH